MLRFFTRACRSSIAQAEWPPSMEQLVDACLKGSGADATALQAVACCPNVPRKPQRETKANQSRPSWKRCSQRSFFHSRKVPHIAGVFLGRERRLRLDATSLLKSCVNPTPKVPWPQTHSRPALTRGSSPRPQARPKASHALRALHMALLEVVPGFWKHVAGVNRPVYFSDSPAMSCHSLDPQGFRTCARRTGPAAQLAAVELLDRLLTGSEWPWLHLTAFRIP